MRDFHSHHPDFGSYQSCQAGCDDRIGERFSKAAVLHGNLPCALVLGLSVNGLAVMRSLGRKGIAVEAADSDPNQPDRYSKYCKRFHTVESLEDESLINFLLDYGQKKVERTVLFITKDRTVPIISINRSMLQKFYYFNLPEQTTISGLMDKALLPEFLSKSETCFPKTFWVRDEADVERGAKVVGLPCVVKPAMRSYGFKASVARTEGELFEIFATASKQTDPLILQEWVPGPVTEIYFCYCYIGRHGEPKAVFVGRKIRQFPNGTGIASEAVGCSDSFVMEETLRLFAVAGYKGFGSTEFRRNPANGSYYLIEFTIGRTDYNVDVAIQNGVDIPFAGYCDMVGLQAEPNLPKQLNKIRWVDLRRNLKAIVEQSSAQGTTRGPFVWEIMRSFSPANAYPLFSTDDLKPFLINVARKVLSFPRRTMGLVRRFWDVRVGKLF